MGKQRIKAALEEATDTRDVNIEAGALASVPEVFRENFGEGPIVIVADGNTFEVAGREVQRRLQEAGYTMMEPYVFPAEPPLYAEYSNIEKLSSSLREHDAIPVAVGSGTLNDIVKRSSHECERSYMCVGTAASMDGYTAFGASIEKDGLKQTLSCSAPKAVVADLEILQDAPENMTASGYADLLGKVTSGRTGWSPTPWRSRRSTRRAGRWSRITCTSGPAARPSCAPGTSNPPSTWWRV